MGMKVKMAPKAYDIQFKFWIIIKSSKNLRIPIVVESLYLFSAWFTMFNTDFDFPNKITAITIRDQTQEDRTGYDGHKTSLTNDAMTGSCEWVHTLSSWVQKMQLSVRFSAVCLLWVMSITFGFFRIPTVSISSSSNTKRSYLARKDSKKRPVIILVTYEELPSRKPFAIAHLS